MKPHRPRSKEPPPLPRNAKGAATNLPAFEASADVERLKVLAARYWSPVYQYLISRHIVEQEAMDLVEDFFIFAVRYQLFPKAEAQGGRFRPFLLASLKDFLAKAQGRVSAKRPRGRAGVASPSELLAKAYSTSEWLVSEDPSEMIFHRAWLQEVVANALRVLREECRKKGWKSHFDLFRAQAVAPRFEGALPPPLEKPAAQLDLLPSQVARQIQTAKRSFQRILAREIRSYTISEADAILEERDVRELLSLSLPCAAPAPEAGV